MYKRMPYVPELQALCARIVAGMCRESNQADRHALLRSLSPPLAELVRAFPTSPIVWAANEQIMSKDIMHHYLTHPRDRHYISKGYADDCVRGITRRKVLWRPCGNHYCDALVLGKVIDTPYDIYWKLCPACTAHQLPYHWYMWGIRRPIEAMRVD